MLSRVQMSRLVITFLGTRETIDFSAFLPPLPEYVHMVNPSCPIRPKRTLLSWKEATDLRNM